MYALLMVVHLIVCIALVSVVLVQSGKGGGLAGGAFGGSAQTVFGGRGATDFVTRATMFLGAAFFVTSIALTLLSRGGGASSRSLIQQEAQRAAASAPARAPGAGGQRPATGGPGLLPPSGSGPATTPATTPAPAAAPAPAPKPPGGK
ncbi:MAG TPA: preprotein translocase subunit SecG [Candidatus Saccharimonadaceae bacterium]|jgi:preprotein translocase subunit SecG|nr:preprotein translocase subunit SecG [Candidatus Saccharimonadaceae bacterium]